MTRSRYFKQAVRHRPLFQWTSDPVEPTKGREDTVHFSSFKLDNRSINTGDYVLVRNTDSPDFAEVRILYYNNFKQTNYLNFIMVNRSTQM